MVAAQQSQEGVEPQVLDEPKNTTFFKHVITLLTGTAAAQLIPIALTPVLTRLFSPADFGQFGIFFSLAMLTGVTATLRYSYALLLPESDQKALRLGWLCIGIAAAISLALVIVVVPFAGHWERLLKQTSYTVPLYLLPVSTFLAGAQATLYTLANRRRAFRSMAISKVVQAAGAVLISILLAVFLDLTSLGLIMGYVAGQVLGILSLSGTLKEFGIINRDSDVTISSVAKRYRGFALLSLPADFINMLTNQLPVFFISYYFTEAIIGQYNLTFRVIMGPLSILGVAILDVFKERAARDYNETGSCRPIFLKTARILAFVGVPLLLILYPLAPGLFAIIFGPEWREAGEYVQVLIPLFAAKFVISPLSYVIYIAERQAWDLVWQIALLVVVAASFFIGGSRGNFQLALAFFTWVYSAMYVLYFYLNYRFSVKQPA